MFLSFWSLFSGISKIPRLLLMWLSLSSLSFSANDQNIHHTNKCGFSFFLPQGYSKMHQRQCMFSVLSVPGTFKIRPTRARGSFSLFAGNNQKENSEALCGFSLSPCLGNSQNTRSQPYGFSVSSASERLKTHQSTYMDFFSLFVGNQPKYQLRNHMWFFSFHL